MQHQVVYKPRLYNAAIPMCNVFFPSIYDQFSEDVNFSELVSNGRPRKREPEKIRQSSAWRRTAGQRGPARRQIGAHEIANGQPRIEIGIWTSVVEPVAQKVFKFFRRGQPTIGVEAMA